MQTGLATALLPFGALQPGGASTLLQAVATAGQFLQGDSERGALVLKRLFLVLQFGDVLTGALEDGALVLLATRDDLGNVLDAFVNDFTTTPFDCGVRLVSILDGKGH